MSYILLQFQYRASTPYLSWEILEKQLRNYVKQSWTCHQTFMLTEEKVQMGVHLPFQTSVFIICKEEKAVADEKLKSVLPLD